MFFNSRTIFRLRINLYYIQYNTLNMDVHELLKLSKLKPSTVTVETTVTSGLESVAMNDISEKLTTKELCKTRGRVFANIDESQISSVLDLRSVDNVYILVDSVENLSFKGSDKIEDLELVKQLTKTPWWDKSLAVWKKIMNFNGILYPSVEEYNKSFEEENIIKNKMKLLMKNYSSDKAQDVSLKEEQILLNEDDNFYNGNITSNLKLYHTVDQRDSSKVVVKYRITCNRSGSHSFGSPDAAYEFGGVLQDMYNWIVDLSYYDLEIVLNIKNCEVYICIALTKESLHRRNIQHFGPTTLRPTICYNLIRLAAPEVGDLIVDPLCGGGSIPVEGVIGFPWTYHICGDIHPKAFNRAGANICDLDDNKKSFVDLCAWDAKNLYIRDASVDILVTDLPFGKRSGSKMDNRTLYRSVLLEMARIAKLCSGRAVLLTHDKRNIIRSIQQFGTLWKLSKTLTVNIGGLSAGVFVLKRTGEDFTAYKGSTEKRKRKNNKHSEF